MYTYTYGFTFSLFFFFLKIKQRLYFVGTCEKSHTECRMWRINLKLRTMFIFSPIFFRQLISSSERRLRILFPPQGTKKFSKNRSKGEIYIKLVAMEDQNKRE